MIAEGDKTPMTIRVPGREYVGMVLVHRCCSLESVDGVLSAVRLVAQGKANLAGEPGPGPFVFIYPADGVDPNQPAFLGMPIKGISF
jgi:hypothetical protein